MMHRCLDSKGRYEGRSNRVSERALIMCDALAVFFAHRGTRPHRQMMTCHASWSAITVYSGAVGATLKRGPRSTSFNESCMVALKYDATRAALHVLTTLPHTGVNVPAK
jgi:hypothetical protein